MQGLKRSGYCYYEPVDAIYEGKQVYRETQHGGLVTWEHGQSYSIPYKKQEMLYKELDCASHESVKRFKDPPPADMKSDPDYEPKAGEWFWWKGNMEYKRQRRIDGVFESNGSMANNKWKPYYKGNCFPATPPE